MMKAAVKTAQGTFEVKEVPRPEITRPDYALARVKVSGICGTDLRSWKVPKPEYEGEIVGHELSGDVVEVGEAVTNVKPGDRVVIETVLGDDTCDWCRVEQYNLCPNLYKVRRKTLSRAFAEYVAGPAKKFHKLPDNVSYEEAALLDTYAVSLHACQITELSMTDKVVIIGAGPIGLSMLDLAKLSGATTAITDVLDFPLQIAQKLDADLIINTEKEDGHKKVLEFTGGRGADITYECAGGKAMPTTFPQAVNFTRNGGKVCLVGGFDAGEISIPLNWEKIQKGEIRIIPSASYAFWDIKSEMQLCIDLFASGKLHPKNLITHSFPLEKINEAFQVDKDKKAHNSIFVALEN